jgi:C4-dicarboxylate transporter, DctQ subunit
LAVFANSPQAVFTWQKAAGSNSDQNLHGCSSYYKGIYMFGKILNVVDKVLTFFEEWTLFITVMVALLALFFNVVLRYGLNYTLGWSEELVREVIIFTTFIGLAPAIRNRSMIKIDALVQLVPKLKMPLNIFSNAVTIVFSLMMIYYGWKMAALQVMTQQKTIIMDIPLVYLYAIIPVAGVLMLLRTIQVIYQDFHEQRAVPAGAE